MNDVRYDVVIIGGGPAGLSAALVLGRCRRRVLIVDAGNPRNVASHGVHGFLTRDGTVPSELLAMARAQLEPYAVELREGTVMSITGENGNFTATLLDESVAHGRRILLATGVVDRVPKLANIEKFYGKSVHHCPYCDGYEHTGGRLAVYGKGKAGVMLAIKLRLWSEDVILCTDGPTRLLEPQLETLRRNDIRVMDKRIRALEGDPPRLQRIMFSDGSCIDRTGMFFATGNVQRSGLFAQLRCETSRKGAIKISRGQRSSIPGVFVAGDAAEDSQYVIVAAAHGARAAMAINNDLLEEDFR